MHACMYGLIVVPHCNYQCKECGLIDYIIMNEMHTVWKFGINKYLFCQDFLCTMPTFHSCTIKLSAVPLSDLIHQQMIKGFDGDLKWHFTKLAGIKGIFDTNTEAFDPNSTLV